MITAASLLLATFAAAYGLTWVVRHYAVVREILDVPNARSSHSVPTPRGGGLAITAALVAGTAVAALLGLIPGRTGLVLAGGSAVIAALGWIDDHVSLRVAVRIPVQALVAVGSVAVLGGMPSLRWGGGAVELGLFGSAIAVVGVLWSTNLYNFMDGVDGIAGVQGISMGALGGLFLLYAGAGDLALMGGLLAAATAGFLPWNWQPAKIFMGDVGSAMLGYALAVLALASENANAVPLIAWAGLYGVFAVDATVTVLRRGMRGQRVSEAHRQHAYQRQHNTHDPLPR